MIIVMKAEATKADAVEIFIMFFPRPPVPQQSTRLSCDFNFTLREEFLIAKTAHVNSSEVSPLLDKDVKKFSIS